MTTRISGFSTAAFVDVAKKTMNEWVQIADSDDDEDDDNDKEKI